MSLLNPNNFNAFLFDLLLELWRNKYILINFFSAFVFNDNEYLNYYYFLKHNFFLIFKEKKTGRRQLKCMSNVTDERESVSVLHIILCL